jgi:ABC-type nitrate/sulfonate/bicarbonate transport system substrate-binding protein
VDDPARRRALSDVLHRAQRANQWARANIEAYAGVYARLTGVDPAIARKVVERENPALYPPDATFATDLQTATDRFVAYGVYPHGVNVAALVDTTLLRA